MDKQEQHDYLMYLIRELEKAEDKKSLDDFITVAQDLLKVRYKLHRLFDYPISAADYDELITFAENLLGVNRFGSSDDLHYEHLLSGRTEGATSAHGASDIVTDALVEQALNEKLNNMMAYDGDLYAFTAKQDIKKGDFVLIDEHDNQSITSAADMEVSPTTLEDLFKEYDAGKIDPQIDELLVEQAMNEDVEPYNGIYHTGSSHSGVLTGYYDLVVAFRNAPVEQKQIWYFEPLQHYFVGDITGMRDFPYVYLKEDVYHPDYVKHTPVVGPFNSLEQLDDYFDLMVREEVGMDDSDFVNRVRSLVSMIKHYEIKDDAANYATIIDKLWEQLKLFLLGNI